MESASSAASATLPNISERRHLGQEGDCPGLLPAYERGTLDMNDDDLLAEQRSYYRARAPEYDEWWQRRGRYDRGEEQLLEWQRQVAVVDEALTSFGATGSVLELAGGTGWWTARLARTAERLTVVDSSPEALVLNQERVGRPMSITSSRISSIGKPTPRMTRCSSPSGFRTCPGPDLASSGPSLIHTSPPWAGPSSSTIETTQCQTRRRMIHSWSQRHRPSPPSSSRRIAVPIRQCDVRAR
jgi:hypothetical protein